MMSIYPPPIMPPKDHPGCWTLTPSMRLWVSKDILAKNNGSLTFSDPNILCKGYATLNHKPTKDRCAGCARIPKGGAE